MQSRQPSTSIKTVKGYARQEIPGNGECGYTALGINRVTAHTLLNKKHASVRDILEFPVRQALLTQEFYNFLVGRGVTSRAHEEICQDDKRWAGDLVVQADYIEYDVKYKCIDAGYAHPKVLQAIAHIQEVELHIWQLDENKMLIPHSVGDENYSSYVPPIVESRVDLLYVNGNHFDLLDLSSYAGNIPEQGIYPLGSPHLAEEEEEEEEEEDEYADGPFPPPAVFPWLHKKENPVNSDLDYIAVSYFGPFIVYFEGKEKQPLILYYETTDGASDSEITNLRYFTYKLGDPVPRFNDDGYTEVLEGPWPQFFITNEDYIFGNGLVIKDNKINIIKRIKEELCSLTPAMCSTEEYSKWGEISFDGQLISLLMIAFVLSPGQTCDHYDIDILRMIPQINASKIIFIIDEIVNVIRVGRFDSVFEKAVVLLAETHFLNNMSKMNSFFKKIKFKITVHNDYLYSGNNTNLSMGFGLECLKQSSNAEQKKVIKDMEATLLADRLEISDDGLPYLTKARLEKSRKQVTAAQGEQGRLSALLTATQKDLAELEIEITKVQEELRFPEKHSNFLSEELIKLNLAWLKMPEKIEGLQDKEVMLRIIVATQKALEDVALPKELVRLKEKMYARFESNKAKLAEELQELFRNVPASSAPAPLLLQQPQAQVDSLRQNSPGFLVPEATAEKGSANDVTGSEESIVVPRMLVKPKRLAKPQTLTSPTQGLMTSAVPGTMFCASSNAPVLSGTRRAGFMEELDKFITHYSRPSTQLSQRIFNTDKKTSGGELECVVKARIAQALRGAFEQNRQDIPSDFTRLLTENGLERNDFFAGTKVAVQLSIEFKDFLNGKGLAPVSKR